MNKQAIEHAHDSRYSFYLDSKRCLIRVRTARNDNIKKITVIWNEWCEFWKSKLENDMTLEYSDELFDYYQTIIEKEHASYEYIIRIIDSNDEVFYLADDGLSKDFEIATVFLNEFMAKFPNDIDLPKLNKNLTGRLFYQIFPERFCCSDFTKKYIDIKWNEKNVKNNHFLGGDFKGIISKIPYLKSLGVGGLWLNPIHKSISAHKYDVDDYFSVDPMFGTIDDFKEFVKVCHEHDIKIVLDMVFNHCGFNNVLFQDVVKNGKKSKYYNWFFIEGDKPDYKKCNFLSFAGFAGMPKLNTNNSEVLQYFRDVILYWADLGVDGFRLDVAFEVSYYFWGYLKDALLKKHPESYFIGEDWMNSEHRLGNYQWDSVMNYPFRFNVMRYFEDDKKDSKWISDRLNALYVRYTDIYNQKLVNLLSSHDTPRWLTICKGDEDYFFMSYAMLMVYPGVPEIYYGDEILMQGEQDPYNRRGMEWDSKIYNGPKFKLFLDILKLRDFESVKYGEARFGEKDGIAFIKRFTDKETITLYFYKGKQQQQFKLENVVLASNYDGQMFLKTGFAVVKEEK